MILPADCITLIDSFSDGLKIAGERLAMYEAFGATLLRERDALQTDLYIYRRRLCRVFLPDELDGKRRRRIERCDYVHHLLYHLDWFVESFKADLTLRIPRRHTELRDYMAELSRPLMRYFKAFSLRVHHVELFLRRFRLSFFRLRVAYEEFMNCVRYTDEDVLASANERIHD